jgi:hypothetical protein
MGARIPLGSEDKSFETGNGKGKQDQDGGGL